MSQPFSKLYLQSHCMGEVEGMKTSLQLVGLDGELMMSILLAESISDNLIGKESFIKMT